jgi:hypothetical protein
MPIWALLSWLVLQFCQQEAYAYRLNHALTAIFSSNSLELNSTMTATRTFVQFQPTNLLVASV